MKKYKKLLAVFLSVIMMLSLSVSNGMLVYAEKDSVTTESVKDMTELNKTAKKENDNSEEEQLKEKDKEKTEEKEQGEGAESEEMNSEESDKEKDETKTEADSEEETKEESGEDTEEVEQDSEDNEGLKEDSEKTDAEKDSSKSQEQKEEAEKVDKTESKTEEETSEVAEETSSAVKEETTAEESSAATGETTDGNEFNKQENNGLEMPIQISPRSMLPIREEKAYLVLNGYSDEALAEMKLSDVLDKLVDADGNSIEIPEDANAVWSYFKDEDGNVIRDEYHMLDKSATVDMTVVNGLSTYTMELIIGSGKQLDTQNVRYIVKVYLTDKIIESLSYELYQQDENGVRTVAPYDRTWTVNNTQMTELGIEVETVGYSMGENAGKEYYFGINSVASEHPYVNVQVYMFSEYLKHLQGMAANTLTDQILNQDMTQKDTGIKGTFTDLPENVADIAFQESSYYVIEYTSKDTGNRIGMICVTPFIEAAISTFDISFTALDENENPVFEDMSAESIDFSSIIINEDGSVSGDATHKYVYMLKEGYSEFDELYCRIDAFGTIYGDKANDYVIKAVEGQYYSLDEVENLEDIKDELFPTDSSSQQKGYKAVYAGKEGGKYFTVFFEDGSIWRILVATTNYDPKYDDSYVRTYTDAPIVGEEDPWFRVTNLSQNGESLDCYAVENGKSVTMDTMYGYGYQTVFINDVNADLSSIETTYWTPDTDRIKVYVDGRLIESGDSVDFSQGPVQFSVTIDDHTKNYLVSVYKKTTESQLYVSGPQTHEVFLDEYFEYKHDILVANLGDKPLTGLRVELDATNCKLDDYWTVGGENNDTLAAFTTTSSSSSYSELANFAKIRLIPDGENDGDIEGTLTVYADGQEPVVINLTGRAQNPAIITDSLDDAVKYVPYSYLITTNNMYDWTSVDMTLEGELPEGVEFYPETGEIYGVPQETGAFPVKITAEFTSETYTFESSTVELTLTVNDNTNDNVYNATDDGYAILDSVGVDVNGTHDYVVTSIEDTVFRSEGVLEEFEGLWLNGEKLVEGVDYTAESGSTKITVNAQTLDGKSNRDGTNTIAAEFRTNDDSGNKLKRTAQNYRLDLSTDDENSDNDRPGNNDGSNSNQNGNTTGNNNSAGNGGSAQKNSNTSSGNSSNNNATGRNDINNTGGAGGTNTGNNGEAGNGTTGTGNNGNTGNVDNTIDGVNVITHIVNADNRGLSGHTVEIHSTPQTATTDQSGYASFSDIDFGNHTIYLKNNDGKELASKEIALVSGDTTSLSGNSITAVKGSSVTVNLKYENGTLKLMSVQSGDQSVPTGDTTNMGLWMTLLVLALSGVAVVARQRRKDERRGI
ncbi:MAG: hypothetical protein KH268_06260 [Clostridiales bacterium]|nr:hypothetical protein [Clostridiales bacterium]